MQLLCFTVAIFICPFYLLFCVSSSTTKRANTMVIVKINKIKCNLIVTIVVLHVLDVEVCV